MCGRYSLASSGDALAEAFGLDEAPSLAPRWNIAPSQPVAVVRVPQPGARREIALVKWGMGDRMSINARAETVAELRAFRDAFRRRRCLVPADGFYEWKKVGARKQPHWFRMRDGRPFAFAGVWDPGPREPQGGRAGPPGGVPGGCPPTVVPGGCAILTTGANDLLRPVHDRMPVIVDARDFALWLDPGVRDAERLRPLLAPFPAEAMTGHAVGPRVNAPRNDGPELIESVECAS